MNLGGAAKKLVRRAAVAVLGGAWLQRVSQFFAGFGLIGPTRNSRQWLEEFGKNPLLFTVVHRIAMDIGGVPWTVYRRDAQNPKLRTEVELDHPLVQLLAQPNAWETGEELMYLVAAYLDLPGEAFLLILRDKQGGPVQVLPLPPHWILDMPRSTRPFYVVNVNGLQEPVPASEIIWIPNPNPLNPYGRGLGTAAALDNQIEQHKRASLFNLNYFRRSARPDVVISVPEDMDQDQIERVRQKWFSEHQGEENAWAPHFINSDFKAQLLTSSMKDMEFVQLLRLARDTVFQLFGVPPEILGIVENSNRATADAAMYIYGMLTLTPRLRRIRAALQRRLVPLFGAPLLVLDFESPVRETMEFRLKMAGDLFTRAIARRDEARGMVGLPPVGGELGDEFLQPTNVVAIDGQGNSLVVGPNQSQKRLVGHELVAAGNGNGRHR